MNSDRPEYLLIESPAALSDVVLELQKASAIGVDLEADSLFHYQERVCLLQVSTGELSILIDPLSVQDLSSLAPIFASNRIRKVFHGADYDIRSLYRDFGFQVRSLFDTQIAARFLGEKGTSLSSVLQKRFRILTDKKYQKKDWSQRPLPVEMLQYAVQDICHLLPLSDLLEKELSSKGLFFCVEEECQLLSSVRPVPANRKPLYHGFKGAGKLDSRSLAVLEGILSFRDQVAKRRNLPPFKVLGNKPIADMVQMRPRTKDDLTQIKGLTPKQINQLGKGFLKKIREGLSLPEEALPVYPANKKVRLTPKESPRVKALKNWRKKATGNWEGDPTLICTNAQIKAIAKANPQEPKDMHHIQDLRKWQITFFGPDICSVLRETG